MAPHLLDKMSSIEPIIDASPSIQPGWLPLMAGAPVEVQPDELLLAAQVQQQATFEGDL